jgi:hypothetical protein
VSGYTALPTKNPGDVLTSALWNTYLQGNADSGFMRMIADSLLVGGPAAQFDFVSIPQTFAHLMVIITGRSDQVANTVAINMRMNNDSSAAYEHESNQGIDAVGSSGQGTAQTVAYVGDMAAASAGAGRVGTATLWIPHYTGTVLNKGWHTLGGSMYSSHIASLRAGQWLNPAAVTRLTIIPGGGNFVVGSRATVYGLPA